MPFFSEKSLVLVKKEVTEGTDPVPTAALNAVMGYNLSVRPALEVAERRPARDSLDSLQHLAAGATVEVSFEFELKGQGAVDVAPRWSPLLQSCLMAETITATVSVAWDPVNSSPSTVTIYAYLDGILHKITGVKGTGQILYRRNSPLRFAYRGLGLYVAPTDAAIASGAVFDTTVPPIVQNIAATIGGYAALIKEMDFDLGIPTDIRGDLNAADGIKGIWQPRREIVGRLVVEAVTEATHPFWANLKAGTAVALGGNTVGSVAGNKISVTAPKLQYLSIEWTEEAGIRTYTIGVKLSPSTDVLSDAIQIKQT